MAPVIKLNSGYDMPQVGFGLWKVPNDVCADVVYNAIKTGYRLFDGACGKSCSPLFFLPSHTPGIVR
jgi:D-xylose reductase